MTRRIHINEDNAHFYDYRDEEDMTVAGLNRLVDTYAADTQVAAVLFCVNVQRALFDSRVWQPLFDGYQPDGPDDQPLLRSLSPRARTMEHGQRGRRWIHNLWLLKERGIDHPQVWLDRCKHHGIEGWLSVRMNDCHHNDDEASFWHSDLWRSRPDLRRIDYRSEGWWEGALDYGRDEVVEHHMRLIDEVIGRYDVDGIELDWVRWVKHFRPGHEKCNADRLTEVMRRTRKLLDARRPGLKLGVRLPVDPAAAMAWGYDVVRWAKERLIDQVTAATFLSQALYDLDVELWRALLGDGVRLLGQADSVTHAAPVFGNAGRVVDYDLLFGQCAAMLHRGADGVYLFNECYREGPRDTLSERRFPGILQTMLNTCGDLQTLRERRRRHAISYHQVTAPGVEPVSCVPQPLTRPRQLNDFNRIGQAIALRLVLGPAPVHSGMILRLGFDSQTPALNDSSIRVWLNGHRLDDALPRDLPGDPVIHEGSSLHVDLPPVVSQARTWAVTLEQAHDDVNIVEVQTDPVPGHLVWAELIVKGEQTSSC